MRGSDDRSEGLFSYATCEARVPHCHPLRAIRAIVDEALKISLVDFEQLYLPIGRPSIAPEKVLCALLLQALFLICPKRQFFGDPQPAAYVHTQ